MSDSENDAPWLAAYFNGEAIKVEPMNAKTVSAASEGLVGYGQSEEGAIEDLLYYAQHAVADFTTIRDQLDRKIHTHMIVLNAAAKAQKEQDDQ